MALRRSHWAMIVAAFVAAGPWLLGSEPLRLDTGTRKTIPGEFVHLKHGDTRYDFVGATPAEVVVFVHGRLGTGASSWSPLARRLRKAGYATLTYDLFGSGYSDRPWEEYDVDLFTRQLEGLLHKLGLARPVHLVAESTGAAVAAEFALRHRESVADIALVGPEGFGERLPWWSAAARVPLFGAWWMQAFGRTVLIEESERAVRDRSVLGDIERTFVPTLKVRGTKRAARSVLRDFPIEDDRARIEALGAQSPPLLLVWGTDDVVAPYALSQEATKLLPSAHLVAVDGVGHRPHLENPDAVFEAMRGFFAETPAAKQGAGRATADDCKECRIGSANGRRSEGGYSPPKPRRGASPARE